MKDPWLAWQGPPLLIFGTVSIVFARQLAELDPLGGLKGPLGSRIYLGWFFGALIALAGIGCIVTLAVVNIQ